jgi:hypothetical protein
MKRCRSVTRAPPTGCDHPACLKAPQIQALGADELSRTRGVKIGRRSGVHIADCEPFDMTGYPTGQPTGSIAFLFSGSGLSRGLAGPRRRLGLDGVLTLVVDGPKQRGPVD